MTGNSCPPADGSPRERTALVAIGAGTVGHCAIELGPIAGARIVTAVSGPQWAAPAGAADHALNQRDAAAHRPSTESGASTGSSRGH
ncbi:hypothetical protein ACWC6I_34710 [Streptomyces sp. NPDC001414]